MYGWCGSLACLGHTEKPPVQGSSGNTGVSYSFSLNMEHMVVVRAAL